MSNALKTTFLLASLTSLLVLVGYAIGGPGAAVIFLIIAGVMNFFAYWFSDKLALSMGGAHEVSAEQDPQLHRMIEEVARLAGVPKPRVYTIESESPNAFATGRNPEHAAVAVTAGIRRLLTERELRAVLAHEIGHVKNRDILIGSIAATIAGAITIIGRMLMFGAMFGGGDRDRGGGGLVFGLLASIVAGFAAMLLQMAISRTREYQADRSGAEYVRDPMSLASALEKLHTGVQMRPMAETAGTQATSSLYIMHPFRGAGGLGKFFSTHPPIEERVKRLRAQAGYNVET